MTAFPDEDPPMHKWWWHLVRGKKDVSFMITIMVMVTVIVIVIIIVVSMIMTAATETDAKLYFFADDAIKRLPLGVVESRYRYSSRSSRIKIPSQVSGQCSSTLAAHGDIAEYC